jgi:hypothetical protein
MWVIAIVICFVPYLLKLVLKWVNKCSCCKFKKSDDKYEKAPGEDCDLNEEEIIRRVDTLKKFHDELLKIK